VHRTPASELPDHATLTLRIPRGVYDDLVLWWDESHHGVEDLAATLLAQSTRLGSPAALSEELEAMTREVALLRAQVKVMALQMAIEEQGVPEPF
jgi:hypothetical protein